MSESMVQLLKEMATLGQLPTEVMEAVTAALTDPSRLDEAIALLASMGADELGGGTTGDIGEYYRPGPGKYELRWPLPGHMPLPVPFDDLDRKTQFYVLFQEWSRRELEAMLALNAGDVAGAESAFEECLERARQIDVAELKARSFEGLSRVAQRRGAREAEREWLEKAANARRS